MNKVEYKQFLSSSYWNNYKQAAYKIFEKKCWFCGSEEKLHLHHTRYCKTTFMSIRKIKNNFRWFLLICSHCHEQIHKLQKENKLEIYNATKLFRDIYYPTTRMSISKNKIKTRLGVKS